MDTVVSDFSPCMLTGMHASVQLSATKSYPALVQQPRCQPIVPVCPTRLPRHAAATFVNASAWLLVPLRATLRVENSHFLGARRIVVVDDVVADLDSTSTWHSFEETQYSLHCRARVLRPSPRVPVARMNMSLKKKQSLIEFCSSCERSRVRSSSLCTPNVNVMYLAWVARTMPPLALKFSTRIDSLSMTLNTLSSCTRH